MPALSPPKLLSPTLQHRQGTALAAASLLEAEAKRGRKFVSRLSWEDAAKPWLQDVVSQQRPVWGIGSPKKAPVAGKGPPAKPQLQEGVSPLASGAKGQEPSLHPTCKDPIKCSAVVPAPMWGRGALLAASRVSGHREGGVKSEQERAGVGRAQDGQQGRAAPSFLAGQLLVTAQQLHAQGDAVVPGHGQDADKAGIERHVKHVLLM